MDLELVKASIYFLERVWEVGCEMRWEEERTLEGAEGTNEKGPRKRVRFASRELWKTDRDGNTTQD